MNRNLIKSIGVFALTVLVVRLLGALSSFPDNHFPQMSSIISKSLFSLSSKLSFSLGDIFYLILTLFGIFFLVKLFQSIWRKRYSDLKLLLSKLFYFLTIVYLIFNVFWGFNYYKKPLTEVFDTELGAIDELKDLAEIYFAKAAELREEVKENENGVFEITLNKENLNKNLQHSVQQIESKYAEIKFINPGQTNLKKSLFSTLFSYLGVSGYFNPFTYESQYNSLMPDSRLLFTQLHETSHQWGFASEAEANFVGFLLGAESGNIEMEYAANFTAMRNLLNRILWYEPEYVKDFVENRYTDGMKRDREYEIEVFMKYDSKAGDAFSLMNEAFLKLNDQEGLQSYGRLVELLVGFNRRYPSN